MIPYAERGIIHHQATHYGYSSQGTMLEMYLPQQPCKQLIFAGIHGEEPESTVLLSKALRLTPPATLRCAVILAANPDGLKRGTRANANGVDLNRNFPAQNWCCDPVFHRWESNRPQEVALSPGAYPASESETQALMQLIEVLKPAQIISIHAPLGCIDDPHQSALATWLATETGLPLVTDIGDPTPGSFGSWCMDIGQAVITYELPIDSIWEMQAIHLKVLQKLLCGEHP